MSDRQAVVTLTDEERISLGFAIGVLDVLSVSEVDTSAEYVRRRDILRKVYDRARVSATAGDRAPAVR